MSRYVLFIISAKPKESISLRIINSIESILADWESLEQETQDITVITDMAAIYTPEALKEFPRKLTSRTMSGFLHHSKSHHPHFLVTILQYQHRYALILSKY